MSILSSYKSFRAGELFELKSNPQLNKESFTFNKKGYPYFTRTAFNNGIFGYVDYLDEKHKIQGNSLAIGMIEMRFHYMEHDFYAGQFTKTAFPLFEGFNKRLALYFITLFGKHQSIFQGVLIRDFENLFYNTQIFLPVTGSGEIDFPFMENRIRELELARIRELELARIRELVTYLQVTGLADYKLTTDEKKFLENYNNFTKQTGRGKQYKSFQLVDLFGTSTRGKRLKSLDRIVGSLPFVTAGEKDTGISAFIGNDVDVFQSNTITIDMFGSAKYRNYHYGADDHVAVVHTENIAKNAAVFITAAIHKVSYNSLWNYSNNFYAKDADALTISLPVDKEGNPDYSYMEMFISIQQKLAIKNVDEWKEKELEAYRTIVTS